MELQIYGNTELAIMPLLPILCVCKKPKWIMQWRVESEQNTPS